MTTQLILFKQIWTMSALIFFYGSLFLTLENLDKYNKMEVILTKFDIEKEKNPLLKMSKSDEDTLTGLEDGLYQFHQMIYYLIVTSITAGYGDISPTTQLSRWLTIVMVTNCLVFFAGLFSDLAKFQKLSSKYTRSFYEKSTNDIDHILLLGEAQPEAIKTFLKECFHSDHGSRETHVVMLREGVPSDEIQTILKIPKFEQRVNYLQGSPFDHWNLFRCQTQTAKCAIIMTN